MYFVGKEVWNDIYVHVSAWGLLGSPELRNLIADALRLVPAASRPCVNVAKVNKVSGRVSMLEYMDFDENPFPVLKAGWTRDRLDSASVSYRSYEQSANPPVLHRKELLVATEYPGRAQWERTTRVAEELGLLEQSHTIGFLLNWERAIASKGFKLVGAEFLPIGNDDANSDSEDFKPERLFSVQRHLTALARSVVSAPVQLLVRYGLLEKGQTFFDYGCGRGDDVEALSSSGFCASGWDPHFAPNNPVLSGAEVVNLGFVLNVIEDPAERVEALQRAFSITRGVLSVAVMLGAPQGHARPFSDGVVTSRGTFQKYFSQQEFKDYLEQVVCQEPFMVGPGVGFLFANKELEQRFVAGRYRTRSVGKRLLLASRREFQRVSVPKVAKASLEKVLDSAAQSILDVLWQTALELGRYPEPEELPNGFEFSKAIPTHGRALRRLETSYDLGILKKARDARANDLRLYFAMQQFAKRERYKALEPRIQRDIKAFYGDYATAQEAGLKLLMDAANPEKVLAACRVACQDGLGWLDGDRSLQLHVSMVDRLPVLLRAYVACAMILQEGVIDASLLKIHVTSGKLTFMEFEDFDSSPLPRMTKRIKVNLKAQRYESFEYGTEFPRPLLFRKSRYLDEETVGYEKQAAFDESLDVTGVLGSSEFGPSELALLSMLEARRLEILGMQLVASQSIPDLDAACGANFTYRSFIACGETQQALQLGNLPKSPETYNALNGLARNILDPVVDYFGAIKLTYGFCSGELARKIKRRIAPELDQHASHELRANGLPICSRGGAACDFIVEDEDMKEVAHWMRVNLPIDRLYFYGPRRPVHVSWSLSGAGEAYEMALAANGRRVPKRMILGSLGS